MRIRSSDAREWLALLVLALLPFHALLVTAGTRLIAGAGHAPIGWLASWKEAVLLVLVLLAVAAWRGAAAKLDRLDACVAFLCVLGMGVSLLNDTDLRAVVYGLKYDLIPLLLFFVLRRASWSPGFAARATRMLLWVGCLAAAYAILTVVLPEAFFRALGYSDLHSLYVTSGPIAAFQQVGGTMIRRIQGAMSGPNQLGMWLLIPWSVALTTPLARGRRVTVLVLLGLAIVLTFSRAATLAAAVVALLRAQGVLTPAAFRRFVAGGVIAFVALSVAAAMFAPALVLRAASTADHLRRPMEAVADIVRHPLGLGLGAAGPASNRLSDACVFLPEGGDASWARDRPWLCVFLGAAQVQPTDRACACPRIPENWYLQIGIELGVLGMAAFIALVAGVLGRLWTIRRTSPAHVAAMLAFAGVSAAALVLHAWEDAAVAYSLWILVALLLPVAGNRRIP